VAVLAPDEVIVAHVLVAVRRYGYEFVGIQETQTLLDRLEKVQPALVREVVPKIVSPILLADILRRLAEERISLRNLREILGALAEWAPHERDPVALTEHVRATLRRQITHQYAPDGKAIGVFLLEPLIEDTIREAVHKTASGSYLALEPALSRDIIQAVRSTIPSSATAPVVLTSADIRRFVKRLIETDMPAVAVLSFQELAPETELQPLGKIAVSAP
jgi:type III secretion protein V